MSGQFRCRRQRIGAAISAGTVAGRAILERRTIHIHDMTAAEVRSEYPEASAFAKQASPFRTLLVVPLLRDDIAIGTITIRRAQMQPFSEPQIKLLETFASQVVIAIENARLFNETKEALEQQTASSEVLRRHQQLADRSPAGLRLRSWRSATRLCDAHLGLLNLYDGERFRTVAQQGGTPEFAQWAFGRGACGAVARDYAGPHDCNARAGTGCRTSKKARRTGRAWKSQSSSWS